MNNQEIRAKALEIAVLIKGQDTDHVLTDEKLKRHYTSLAEEIEQYIRAAPADENTAHT